MSSVQEEKTAEGTAKTRTHELRNAELVSRLLAATPPYLYSALPLQPHAFFFSEMLRSFVSARHGCRPSHYHRRFKRRAHKYFAENEEPPPAAPPSTAWQRRDWHTAPPDQNKDPTTPLELTVDKNIRSPKRGSPKPEQKSVSPTPPNRPASLVDVGTEDLPKPAPCTATVPPSNLILPPPPPMWYPPLYNPQFGVDPLNFFIDLRVSGHIYDRKRAVSETVETNVSHEVRNEESIDKRLGRDLNHRPRHVSAFSVPVKTAKVCVEAPTQYFDHSNPKVSGKVNSTSYVMRNLKRVYENVRPLHDGQRAENSKTSEDNDTKAECSEVEEDIVE